jgi:DegV family protein with EDD domain
MTHFGMLRMARVAIVTDSTADLAPHIAREAGIVTVPASISLGASSIREPAHTRQGHDSRIAAPAGTSEAPPPAMVDAFAAAFAHAGKAHDEIVAVLLSHRLGDAVAAASQARERMANMTAIEIVDSRSASLGLGFQALRAAELARRETSAAAVAAELRAALDRYHVVFSIESIEHLRVSGRVGRSAAIIADALQLKPLLRIDEGQIVPYERARTRARAIAELAEFVCALPAVERVAALYATNQDDGFRLASVIAAETGLDPERFVVARIGSAVAAHVGPGALGIAVVESEAR